MEEIKTTKIDGVEFVTLTDYLRLKEEKEKIENLIEISKTEGKKVVKNGKWFVRICGDMSEPMVRLEDFQMIVREREQLKKEKQELEYLGDINEKLKEENKKLNNDYLIAQEEIKQLKNQIKHLIKWDKSVGESLIQAYKDLEHYVEAT